MRTKQSSVTVSSSWAPLYKFRTSKRHAFGVWMSVFYMIQWPLKSSARLLTSSWRTPMWIKALQPVSLCISASWHIMSSVILWRHSSTITCCDGSITSHPCMTPRSTLYADTSVLCRQSASPSCKRAPRPVLTLNPAGPLHYWTSTASWWHLHWGVAYARSLPSCFTHCRCTWFQAATSPASRAWLKTTWSMQWAVTHTVSRSPSTKVKPPLASRMAIFLMCTRH